MTKMLLGLSFFNLGGFHICTDEHVLVVLLFVIRLKKKLQKNLYEALCLTLMNNLD